MKLAVLFGSWSPDSENQVTLTLPIQAPLTVPLADAYNLYYQDGNYRSIPAPIALGPALDEQALCAFSWYDNAGSAQMLFAGSSDGLQALLEGEWSEVPVIGAVAVAAQPWTLSSVWASAVYATPWVLTSTMGTTGVLAPYTGTLMASAIAGGAVGYVGGTYGAIAPVADTQGNAISELTYIPGTGLVLAFSTAALGAAYFTTLAFPSLSKSFLAADATYQSSAGQSYWTWAVSPAPFPAGSYPVTIS